MKDTIFRKNRENLPIIERNYGNDFAYYPPQKKKFIP